MESDCTLVSEKLQYIYTTKIYIIIIIYVAYLGFCITVIQTDYFC